MLPARLWPEERLLFLHSRNQQEEVSTKMDEASQTRMRQRADTPTSRYVFPSVRLEEGVLLLILSIPSLYVLWILPPLWRDSDGFNEIASTFAPKGIIHWLPGYCLGGRLIVFAGSVIDSLLRGHGIPYLSISITPLSDAGIYTLIVVQHLFLILSLFYAVRTASDHFQLRVLFAGFFALTPWIYVYANCIGSEAFSNPLVYLVAAWGWNCLRAAELNRRKVIIYFGLLLTAALTRQVNALLAAGLPLALLPLAGKEWILRGSATNLIDRQARYRHTRKLLISTFVAVAVIGSSLFVQQTMCWLCRVPFRSTAGETFMWRLSYLKALPQQERTAILARISAKLADPVVTEALDALNQSLNRGEKWTDMYLFYKIDEILLRSGLNEMQHRTWQIDLKLNRIAICVLLSGDPDFLKAVGTDFVRSPYFTQTDLAHSPFELTDWLQTQLPFPRYDRLRGLASFQHEEGYYATAWKRISYFHLFDQIPILEMVYLTMTFVGLVLFVAWRDAATGEGVAYVAGIMVVAILITLANCSCTFFAARFYLPVYSLLQMAMLFAASLAAKILIKRLAR